MLSRIIGRSLVRRRRRKLLSLAAVALGITVATTVATIALDVGDSVSRELRAFGANISVTPAADGLPVEIGGVDYRPAGSGAFLAERDLVQLKRIFWRNNITAFAPFLYVPGQVHAGTRSLATVVVGSWFDHAMAVDRSQTFVTGLKKLHPAWRVNGAWPKEGDSKTCLVGRRLARSLDVQPGREVAVNQTPFTVSGTLDAGGAEDDQVLAPLEAVQKLAGLEGKVRNVEVSALTKPDDELARMDPGRMSPADFERWSCANYASTVAYQIQQAIPGSEARPVYHVSETEGRIMNRVGVVMWILVVAGLITAGLAVASMMLASVLERRAEIGLFQSLGATDARIATLFLLEAASLGGLGGIVGYLTGSLLARRLAVAVFGLPSPVHWVLFPAAIAVAVTVALVGSAVPLAHALKVSPAVVLRD
ncbi:MAG TPA: FtsX-like permease family protein [Terriglobia bacterium]|nr:FtsX-like permease family protein [Terriglobia bacterium]